MFFVFAIHTLLKSEITNDEIHKAGWALNMYSGGYGSLYRNLVNLNTLPLHSIRHLADPVKQLGPLWCHATSIFDSAKFNFIKSQQATDWKICQGLENMMQMHNRHNMLQFLNNCNSEEVLGVSPKVKFLGTPVSSGVLRDSFIDLLMRSSTGDKTKIPSVQIFSRVKRCGAIFTSKAYTMTNKSCSCYILYRSETGEKIPAKIIFFATDFKDSDRAVFVGRRVNFRDAKYVGETVADLTYTVEHILPFEETASYFSGDVNNILCHLIKINNLLCIPPNTHMIFMLTESGL